MTEIEIGDEIVTSDETSDSEHSLVFQEGVVFRVKEITADNTRMVGAGLELNMSPMKFQQYFDKEVFMPA